MQGDEREDSNVSFTAYQVRLHSDSMCPKTAGHRRQAGLETSMGGGLWGKCHSLEEQCLYYKNYPKVFTGTPKSKFASEIRGHRDDQCA